MTIAQEIEEEIMAYTLEKLQLIDEKTQERKMKMLQNWKHLHDEMETTGYASKLEVMEDRFCFYYRLVIGGNEYKVFPNTGRAFPYLLKKNRSISDEVELAGAIRFLLTPLIMEDLSVQNCKE